MTDEKIIARMQADQEQGWPLCPRCGERMPDKLTHGALSRHAKGVYICEACGTDEALRDWIGNVKPLSDWVLVRVFEVKEQAEHRAFAASVEKYLPVNEILNCYKMGMTENWEIAEYFNLEEEFVEKAVHYWTDCKGIDFNCL